MSKKFIILIYFIFFTKNLFSYNYVFKSDSSSIDVKFDGSQISEIKFEFLNNNQKNFGIISYHEEEIDITLNTNIISFDEFKKYFQNIKKNQNYKKKSILVGR